LEYVAREAQKATTKNPVGLATQAIREAWNPPAVPMGGTGGVSKAAQARATVASLTNEQRAELLARVLSKWPNLRGVPKDDAAVVGEMARIAKAEADGGPKD
jgi:hypothetical protein